MVNLAPTKLQARVSTAHYHAGNLLPGTNASYYNIRDTNTKLFYVNMAKDGVIDAGLALNHDLTASGTGVDVVIEVRAVIDLAAVGGNASSPATILWSGYTGERWMKSGSRWWVLPEVSVGVMTDTTRQIEVPELRAPIDALQVRVIARATPDAGSFNMRVVRRY